MRTGLCDRFGVDYPIFVFTPSEKVAAAVSKAGGPGVRGCVRFNEADDLETVLPVAEIIAELVSGFDEASRRPDGIRES